jgi:hypothetical protein
MNFFIILAFISILAISAQEWQDTEATSLLWTACSRRDTPLLKKALKSDPSIAFLRSADGRGPLFWAYEFGDVEAIEILENLGLDPLAKDAVGLTPKQLGIDNEELNKRREFPPPSNFDEIVPDEEEEDDEEEEEEDDDEEL